MLKKIIIALAALFAVSGTAALTRKIVTSSLES